MTTGAGGVGPFYHPKQIKEVKKVHTNVQDLRGLNDEVAERSSELRAEQTRIDEESKTLQAALAGVEEEMRRSTQAFRLDKSTLEADGQRIVALRSDVGDLETRFRRLEDAGQSVDETNRKVDDMAARATTLSGDLSRLSEQVELVEGTREGMSEAQRTAVEVAATLSSIEARQSDVQEAVDGVRMLRGVQEEVAGALERLRATRSEIDRMQAGQAETGTWLAQTHESVRELRTNVARLGDLEANVDHMRRIADRVVTASADLEERRDFFDQLEARMSELRQVGTRLDERTHNLLGSLEDADQRFKAVAREADQADAVRVTIDGVVAEVQQAERRMAGLGEGVDSAVERSEALNALSERVDRVMADVRQREQALSKAADQLVGVSTLRKEAAEVVQSLEDKIRGLNEGLTVAEEQSEKIGQRADVTRRASPRSGCWRVWAFARPARS